MSRFTPVFPTSRSERCSDTGKIGSFGLRIVETPPILTCTPENRCETYLFPLASGSLSITASHRKYLLPGLAGSWSLKVSGRSPLDSSHVLKARLKLC